jgi:prolyl 4-hydroxylase
MIAMFRIDNNWNTGFNYTDVDGESRTARIVFTLANPPIAFVRNLLTRKECERFRAIASRNFHESTVVHNDTGEGYVMEGRVSDTSHIVNLGAEENTLISSIETRISGLTGIPTENGEAFQVQRYKAGGYFSGHFDYFDPNLPGSTFHMRAGGQRIATVILYLSDVELGGTTRFPNVGDLNVRADEGSAVFFHNVDSNNQVIPATLHSGEPVVGDSEKWIATKWIRERRWC